MIQIFSTCPRSSHVARSRYLGYVADVARWTERAGWAGTLVSSDNSLVDPWILSHVIVRNSESLRPLVAVQPAYMHPYCVAKQITSFAYLYGRRLSLDLNVGAPDNDLDALGDTAPRDRRVARLVEYTHIVTALVETGGPLTTDGAFYKTVNLRLTPPLPKSLRPEVIVSGPPDIDLGMGRRAVRVGIIARDRADHAWTIARSRFPEDRVDQAGQDESPYWMAPFHRYRTRCPYLVGTYDTIAREVGRHLSLGYETFILDVPSDPEELEHVNLAFARANSPQSADGMSSRQLAVAVRLQLQTVQASGRVS
jgi:alkanesulfonate monooxygenase